MEDDLANRAQGRAILVIQPATDDGRRRTIDQIPTVDERGMRKVEVVNLLALRLGTASERVHKKKERQRAFLVNT